MGSPTGPGSDVGSAVGQILIDTSQLVRAQRIVVSAGREMEGAFSGFGNQLRSLQNSFRSFGSQAQLSLGIITAAGLASAQSVRSLELRMRMLAGSEQNAGRLMAQLRTQADRAGQPFLELAQSAAGLLPAIRGTNAEMNTLLSLSQRLQVLDPTARAFDTQIALREFLSGEVISLSRRFEISRTVLQNIMDQAGGDTQRSLELLSDYLDSVGITQEAIEEMGRSGANAFSVLRSEVTETLGTAFMPLLQDVVIPLVSGFGDLLQLLRQVNPEALRLGAAFAGLIGAQAAVSRLGGMVGIPGIGRAVGIGASGIAGAAIGGELFGAGVNAGIIQTPQAEAIAAASLGDKLKIAGATLLTAFATAAGQLRERFAELGFTLRDFGMRVQDAIGQLVEGIGNAITAIGGFINNANVAMTGVNIMTAGSQMRNTPLEWDQFSDERTATLEAARAETEAMTESMAEFAVQLFGGQEAVDRFNGTVTETAEALNQAVSELANYNRNAVTFTGEQVQAWIDYQGELRQLEKDAQAQRQQQLDDYERRRTETEARYQQTLTRDNEDEARRAERSTSQHNEKLAGLETAHFDRLTEIRDKARESEQDALDRWVKDRAQLSEDIADAAARLDADAVSSLTRRRDEQDAEYLKQKEQRQAQLDDQLTQERTAYGVRRNEQIAQFAEEERLNAENRAIRLDRQAQDHAVEMARMEQDNAERLTAIDSQLAQETAARDRAFLEQFNSLAAHENTMLNIQQAGQDAAEAELRAWWNRMATTFGNVAAASNAPFARRTASGVNGRLGGYQNFIPEYATGGMVGQTGLAMIHAGEYVLPASTVSDIRGGTSTAFNVQSMTINVGDIGNRNDEQVKGLFFEAMDQWLDTIAVPAGG